MGKRPTFRFPQGLKLEITADSINIEYDGDVEIEQDLGRRFNSIKVGGDLTIKLPKVSGDLVAGGVLPRWPVPPFLKGGFLLPLVLVLVAVPVFLWRARRTGNRAP